MEDAVFNDGPSLFVEKAFTQDRLFFGFLITPEVGLKDILECFDKPELCNYFLFDEVAIIFHVGTEVETKEAVEALEEQVVAMGFNDIADYYRNLSKDNKLTH